MGNTSIKGHRVISWPDKKSQDVCCLPGAKIRDIAERVPQLVKSNWLLSTVTPYVGMNDTASQNLGRSKENYKALGVQVKNLGDQVIFSSILPVGEKGAKE